jgi:acyl-CoA synthetase (AMP-forming)/AMP-acid ligase II
MVGSNALRTLVVFVNSRSFFLLLLPAPDTVALMLENSPFYSAIWLGFAKIGVTTALINSHLKGVPLVKTFDSAKAKFFVVG